VSFSVRFIKKITDISIAQWAELANDGSPFLSYEFLSALETFGCVGEEFGWLPSHLLVEDEGRLVAFMPLYSKFNSYGEFVFDWSWAEAYQRHGLAYYPKLVSSIPYTPVSGARVLFAKKANKAEIFSLIAKTIKERKSFNEHSSFHCLFPKVEEVEAFEELGLSRRLGCQFHWVNAGYESFDHYLSFFTSRKRKNIKKERKSVAEQGFDFHMLHGDEIEADMWPVIYEFYKVTFYKKSGAPTFTQAFFEAIGKALGENFLVNLVSYKGQYVACAIFYRDQEKLYGRHWGCFEDFNNLHFETCYYQGLEYAIKHGLSSFEPGAQGEHKVSRGFLPVETWSVHWINDRTFRGVIADFLQHEERYMREYIKDLSESSPFKA